MSASMIDPHGRRMRKLRISLLDACNMRCSYCMPDAPHFLPKEEWLTAGEIAAIAGRLVGYGIEEIRLTGGEPTLRRDLVPIAQALSALPLKKLGLTSNGLLLGPLLPALAETNCRHLNISLDSLDAENFRRITGRDGLPTVLGTILKARDLGFSVKVNVVALRGLNDHEALDFVAWSAAEGIPVRFLEVMKIGVMGERHAERFIAAREMIAAIRERHALTPQIVPADATAYSFRAENGAEIGFIASESEAFCGTCSRLRLTPTGQLRPCLFTDQGLDLRGLAEEDYPATLTEVLAAKPGGRLAEIRQPMYQIGG